MLQIANLQSDKLRVAETLLQPILVFAVHVLIVYSAYERGCLDNRTNWLRLSLEMSFCFVYPLWDFSQSEPAAEVGCLIGETGLRG